MDEKAVREHAQGHLDALIAGDVGRALEDLSAELRSQRSPGHNSSGWYGKMWKKCPPARPMMTAHGTTSRRGLSSPGP